ncbi:hypothetical protein CAEBREN_10888 [Caenorhabditis brenneri]|uniref:BUD13 homolog n=1 Tax=Caenorhabditis brenneri TaxID=135651 RepID=G0NB33_CAEBE|nr:hypothetical protein CAEBREN_10888 [Caenorhabditis brenneri]
MTSKADYLKKYMSIGDEEKKKKKKKKENKDQPQRLRLIEEDAFLSVEAAKARDIGSDEEQEEIEVLKQSAKKAKVVHGFKQSFALVETPKEIKEEPLSPSSSPPKNSRATSNRKRHDSDSDNSPPRPARRRHDSDNSPPRPSRRRHDSDNSPPRPSRRRHDSDNSPPRTRHDADKGKFSNNSPVRRRQSSPPSRNRRDRHDSDNSPPRQRARQDDRDSSPPRHRKHHDDDLSPPRKSRRVEEPKMIKKEEPDDDGEYGKTLEGKKSGLQSAKDLKEESDKLKAKNAKMFEDMDTSVSGRFADTVYRQKQTKRKGRDAEEDQEKKEREAKKTEELKEKYKDWNKGVAQIEERKAQLEEMARVAAEPMARARDDDAMNAHLKEVLHAADPMANLIQKKRRDIAIDRGELVYPTYQGHWVPNRFGIAPGYRWDGVDRSNGFEGKLAKTANTKAANQSEYYKSIAEYE